MLEGADVVASFSFLRPSSLRAALPSVLYDVFLFLPRILHLAKHTLVDPASLHNEYDSEKLTFSVVQDIAISMTKKPARERATVQSMASVFARLTQFGIARSLYEPC